MKFINRVATHPVTMIYWSLVLVLVALNIWNIPEFGARVLIAGEWMILAVAIFVIGLKVFQPDNAPVIGSQTSHWDHPENVFDPNPRATQESVRKAQLEHEKRQSDTHKNPGM